MIVSACGGGGSGDAAACALSDSEFGPLVEQMEMSETEAEALMAARGISTWLRIDGTGDWGQLWAYAENEVGSAIHDDLSWIQLDVRVDDVDGNGSTLHKDVIVSRSYVGKIETTKYATFEPLAQGSEPDLGSASCHIESITFADEQHEDWLDLTDLIEIATP